jgi:hypothetical protein
MATQRASSPPKLFNRVAAHDYFNLVYIALLNAMNMYYICTRKGFEAFFFATVCYFFLDMCFVAMWPRCVKSPVVIISHHLLTSVYILIPYHYPDYQWCMSACMLVELNTWLLIARRTFPKVRALNVLFYITWVALRNILYPVLIYLFYKEWQNETRKSGTAWNLLMVTPVFQTFLSVLNYYWSAELIAKKVKHL